MELISSAAYLTYQYRLNAGASDVTVTPEITGNLATWVNGAANIVTMSGPVSSPNGTVTWKVRDVTAADGVGQRQFHLKMTGP